MNITVASPQAAHVVWAPFKSWPGRDLLPRDFRASESAKKSLSLVNVANPDLVGICAIAFHEFHKGEFNIEYVSVNKMAGLLNANYLVSSPVFRPEVIEKTSQAVLEKLNRQLQTEPLGCEDGKKSAFVIDIDADRDDKGIMATVTRPLAEHRANIVWISGGAITASGAATASKKEFFAQIKIELPKAGSALKIVRIKSDLEAATKDKGWGLNLVPARFTLPGLGQLFPFPQ